MENNQYPIEIRSSYEFAKKSINEWLLEYNIILSSYPIQEKTLKNRTVLIRWISKHIGDKPIGLIKPYEIALAIKTEYKNSPAKAKRLLIEVKNMFTEAIIYGWIDRNPAAHLKAQSAPVLRERLTLKEWNIILEESLTGQKWITILIQLALITGQRRSDLLNIKYSDIIDGNLQITQQKSRNKISIPLNLRLECIDKSLGELVPESKFYAIPGDNVIRKSNGYPPSLAQLSQSFTALVKRTINKNTTLHECRSLSERLYRSQGLNTRLLLGHKRQDTTDLYNDSRGINSNCFTLIKI